MQKSSDTSSSSTEGLNKNFPDNTNGKILTAHKRHVEIEELDAAIEKLNHSINAANYQLMVLIREFDERAGWLKWGFTDGLSWLKWRCDIGTGAAREKLRIAHALKELPLLSEAFASGSLSYTKVRALTRIATAENEEELITMALRMTARHVEEHCKQRKNASPDSTKLALGAQKNAQYRVWRDEARGTVHFSIELPAEEAELVEKAVEKAAVQLSTDLGNSAPAAFEKEENSWSNTQASALTSLCRSFLDGYSQTTVESSPAADHYQVVVHVDETALKGSGEGASELPLETVRRLCCDGSVVPVVENASGEPLNVGRKSRTVTTPIRRALWARDKGCGYPGCTHTRFVDAHHIKHWADGGETSVDNMVLLCSSHHKLVHEGGYDVQRDNEGQLFFRRPDGKAVPH